MRAKIVKKKLVTESDDWISITAKVPLWCRSFEDYTEFIFEYGVLAYRKSFQRDWRRFVKLKRDQKVGPNASTDNQQLHRLGLWES